MVRDIFHASTGGWGGRSRSAANDRKRLSEWRDQHNKAPASHPVRRIGAQGTDKSTSALCATIKRNGPPLIRRGAVSVATSALRPISHHAWTGFPAGKRFFNRSIASVVSI